MKKMRTHLTPFDGNDSCTRISEERTIWCIERSHLFHLLNEKNRWKNPIAVINRLERTRISPRIEPCFKPLCTSLELKEYGSPRSACCLEQVKGRGYNEEWDRMTRGVDTVMELRQSFLNWRQLGVHRSNIWRLGKQLNMRKSKNTLKWGGLGGLQFVGEGNH